MSKLGEALLARMYDIVYKEGRSFCYLDFFPCFTVDGKTYSIAKGTFRNKLLELRRQGLIELYYRSHPSFYTLPGANLPKKAHRIPQTPEVNSIHEMVMSLPMDQRALHDIRLRFSVEGIWSTLSSDSRYNINARSKDIKLEPFKFGDLEFLTTVHRTDVVSVIVACSMHPLAADVNGLLMLSECLTRLEYELTRHVNRAGSLIGRGPLDIPRYTTWLVTMWHFGRDSLAEYTQDAFCISFESGRETLLRIYTKDMKAKGRRIRIEEQEYPNKSFAKALEDKLYENLGGS